MGNENERKRDPAENRLNRMGHVFDEVKTGGEERNVGQTGDTAGAGRGQAAGTGGVIGGSPDFLDPQRSQGDGDAGGEAGQPPQGAGNQRGDQGRAGGDSSYGGQAGAGSSAIGGNSGRSDLGSAGVGSGSEESDVGPGGYSPTSGASDLGGGETGLGDSGGFVGNLDDESGEYLQDRGNPQAGFAEQGRGAPNEDTDIERGGQRSDKRNSDVEGGAG